MKPAQVRQYSEEDPLTYGIERGQRLFQRLAEAGVALGERLLDVGCGYGGISLCYAKAGRTAFALDIDLRNIGVLRRRVLASEAASGKVLPFAGLADAIPLADATVDIALMIGVVEWLGYSDSRRAVRNIQIEGIKEVLRVLRPGGFLIIGTKNRLFPRYLWRDGQLKRPLVNALPRPVANWVSLNLWDHEYRGHIYSYWGWKRLIAEAGFILSDTLVPIFNYQFPLMLVKPWGSMSIGRQVSAVTQQLPPDLLALVSAASPTRKMYYQFISILGLLGLGAGTFLFICEKPAKKLRT